MKYKVSLLICLIVPLLVISAYAAELWENPIKGDLANAAEVWENLSENDSANVVSGSYTEEDFPSDGLSNQLTTFATISDPDLLNNFYGMIYYGLSNRLEEIYLGCEGSGFDEESAEGIGDLAWYVYCIVVTDCPELCYARTACSWYIRWNSNSVVIKIVPEYFSEIKDAQMNQFNSIVDSVVQAASQLDDPVEQMLYVHDYLVVNCAYNWEVATIGETENEIVYSAYGALVNGDAVCQGYALAYKVILDRLDIACCYISSDPMNHAWNIVGLNVDTDHEKWYHVDVTWDDPAADLDGYCSHDFFLVSDTTMKDEYHGHHDWEWTGYPTPVCDDKTYESETYVFANNSRPMYYKDGYFYYLREGDASLDNAGFDVYRTEQLNQQGECIGENVVFYSDSVGIVWNGDYLYYTIELEDYTQRKLGVFDLSTGRVIYRGNFTFIPTAVPEYEETYDCVGLRYNASKNCLEATSSNRRSVLGSFPLQETYPSSWSALDPNVLRIAGISGNKSSIGVVVDDNEKQSMQLYVGYYLGGRMVSAGIYEIHPLAGLQIVDLEQPRRQYDTVRAFLVSGSAAPLCESAAA